MKLRIEVVALDVWLERLPWFRLAADGFRTHGALGLDWL